MGEKKQDQFSVDEILEEQKKQQRDRKAGPSPSTQPGPRADDTQDVSAYATQGAARAADDDREAEEKEKRGLFGRKKKKKKKKPDFVDDEDTYYGIQLKPIDEYRKGYNQVTGEFSIDADSYATLFEESKKAIDDGGVEKNFDRIQRERRVRAGQTAEFSTMEQGIRPPSHTQSVARPPAQGAGATGAQAIPGKPGNTAARPPAGKTAPVPQATAPHRTAPQQNDGRVQVIPKVSSIYEYRSHGIPTHIINVKILQEALASGDIYRTSARANTAVRQPTVSTPVQPVAETQPAAETQPVVETPPVVQEAPIVETPSVQETPPEAASQETKVLQEPIPVKKADGAAQSPPDTQETSAAQETPVSAPAAGETAETQPAAAAQTEERTPTRKIPAVKKQPEDGEGHQPTVRIPPLESADAVRAAGPVRQDTVQPPAAAEIEQPAGVEFEEVASWAAGETAADALPEQGAASARQRTPTQKWVEPEESVEDYNGPEDAKAISDELKSDMRDLTLRMVITGGCTLILALINLIFGGTFSSGQANAGSSVYVYLVLTLVFLSISIAVNYRTILNGLKALFAFNATSDSAVAAATLGVCVQTVTAFFFTTSIVDKEQYLYAAVLTAVLLANAAGKLTMLRRIHSNFRFVTSKEQKYAVHVCEDEAVATKMAGDVVVGQPVLAYQNKTGFLKRFLEMSYLPDPAETSSQMLAPIGLIASLVLCIVCMLLTQSIPSAIGAMTASLIACVAVSNMLAVNLPVSRLSKLARRAGGMIVGYEAVQRFGETNAVTVDAQELFPTGTVILNGIKTYMRRDDVEEAILAASALVDVIGGPLCGVFEQVITENEENLPKVETFEYEYERGMVGRVDGRTIYVGNRALLLNHRVDLPAKEEEAQYAVGGKQVLYIAVETHVAAMMVMTYTADRRKKNEVQRLEDSGISVVVRSTDPNLTVQMLARLFGVDVLSLSVMNAEMASDYQVLMSEKIARSDAVMATKGRLESLITLISACVKEKRGVNLIVTLQTVAVVLGFVLVAFLACFGAISGLTGFILFLFEAIWAAVILLLPTFRR